MFDAPSRRSRKAVITAAGFGTRFLPATKAVPKELLPVVDIPAMQYIVEEAVAAGLDDVLVISSRGKDAIVDHFDRAPEVEAALMAKGDADRLAAVRRPAELAAMNFVRQGELRGLGHAVSCAKSYVGDDAFAVMLGDDIIDARDELLSRMVQAQAELGGCVIALMPVPHDRISMYGCVAVESTGAEDVVRITDLVEKPPADQAPSDLAIIGRYVLSARIFDALAKTAPGRGGEIQLTDALRALTEEGEPVHGVVFRGRRYDIGDRLEYLQTVVRFACERPDLGPQFRAWLTEFVATQR